MWLSLGQSALPMYSHSLFSERAGSEFFCRYPDWPVASMVLFLPTLDWQVGGCVYLCKQRQKVQVGQEVWTDD